MKTKVIVGLSGGVDSSVAALLLQEQGYDVHGAIMQVWPGDKVLEGADLPKNLKPGCYGPDEKEDIIAAQKIADKLGIPLDVIDLRSSYQKNIVDYFRAEYQNGRTPNPCIECNKLMKFGFLIESMKNRTGTELFATGHYTRVNYNNDSGRYNLYRGIDPNKDQSYFLYTLSQNQLKNVLFPIGNYEKSKIKEIAKSLGLGLEDKQESQNFASMGNHTLLEDLETAPGEIVDIKGDVLGEHRGLQYYTIGQRKGLGISSAHPLYVVKIDKERNQVVVDTDRGLFRKQFILSSINWIAFEKGDAAFQADVKIRYRHDAAPALVTPQPDGSAVVDFDEEVRAITPGQSAVIYQGDLVIGGGIIEKVSDL